MRKDYYGNKEQPYRRKGMNDVDLDNLTDAAAKLQAASELDDMTPELKAKAKSARDKFSSGAPR